tara:strand:- start:1138 stop:1353 length:216 start_codon:yes stop_codon:yes gene_type:complete
MVRTLEEFEDTRSLAEKLGEIKAEGPEPGSQLNAGGDLSQDYCVCDNCVCDNCVCDRTCHDWCQCDCYMPK